MKINLTNNRINRIKNSATDYIHGKKSYLEAFSAAKSEGILGYFRNYNNKAKKSTIKDKFLAAVQDLQVEITKNSITELQNLAKKSVSAQDTHTLYQQAYSNINFENSNIKIYINSVTPDKFGNIKINIIFFDKMMNDSTTESQIIQPDSTQIRDKILAEYKIFNHKQFGIGDLSSNEYSNSAEANILIDQYKAEQKKFQYDAICFSGGGAKGIGFLGVLDSLGEHRLKNVKSVSGASAGAITAALVASGIKPYELTEFVGNKNLRVSQTQLRELIRSKLSTTIVTRLDEYITKRTSSLTEVQTESIHRFRKAKDITFGELNELVKHFSGLGFKDLFINAHLVDSSPTQEVELSAKTCPNMPISLAVVSSAALPILYAPIDVTAFFDENSRKNLGINMESIRLNDGGIVSNIPYGYLSATNPLIVSFKGDRLLHETDLSISEKIKNYLAGAPAYIYRRADKCELENQVFIPFYLDTREIKTTSFEEAARQVVFLNQSIKKDFIKYDIMKKPNPNKVVLQKKAKILNILKFIIYPMYYNGNLHQQTVLNTIYEGGKTYFRFLNEENDFDKFNLCYKSFRKKVNTLQKCKFNQPRAR